MVGYLVVIAQGSALTITQSPASVSVPAGTATTLSIIASGSGLTYQWRRLGVPIPGATENHLDFPAIAIADSDFYDVEVGEGQTTLLSQAAQVQVTPPSGGLIYRMDTSFTPCFSRARDSQINAVAVAADRSLVIGGGFSVYQGQRRDNLARVTAWMELDPSFRPELDGPVGAVEILGDGKILVGGAFTSIDGIPAAGLARLNPDGTVDHTFDFGAVFRYATVGSLLRQPDGKILVTGSFGQELGSSTGKLLRLLPSGALDASFAFTPFSGSVVAAAIAPDGKIFVAGTFNLEPSPTQIRLMRLQADGTPDLAFTPSTDGMLVIRSMVVQSDGRVVVARPYGMGGLVRFLANGAVDSSFVCGLSPFPDVASLMLLPGDKLLVGGVFDQGYVGSETFVARLFADGAKDTTFAPPLLPDERVLYSASHPDGGVIWVGAFGHIGAAEAAGVVHVSDSGVPITMASGYQGSVGTIHRVLQLPGDRWLVAGDFTHVGSVPRARLAVVKVDGSVDETFDSGTGLGGALVNVTTLLRDGAGRLLISGDFDSYNGQACKGLVRVLPDGTLDSSFTSSLPEGGGGVRGVQIDPVGRISVTMNRRLYRLLDTGALDPSWVCAPGDFWPPTVLGVQADGRVLVKPGTINPPNFADRLNPDGSIDPTFTPGFGGTLYGMPMVVQPSGSIVVGGDFQWLGGAPASGLVQLSSTGAVERQLIGVEYLAVEQILPLADASLLLFGRQPWESSTPRSCSGFNLVHSDWSVDRFSAFDATASRPSQINILADGRMLLIGNSARRGLARASGMVLLKPETVSPTPSIVDQPADTFARVGASATLSVTVAGEGELSYQWSKDDVPLSEGAGPTLTIASAQYEDGGLYDVVVTNDFGTVTSRKAQLVIHNEDHISYASWAAAFFSESELADPRITGPEADPEGCGLPNLARYAFKLPARGTVSSSPVQITNETVDTDLRLVFSFHRKTCAPGIRYVVEVANELTGPWYVVDEVMPGAPEEVIAYTEIPRIGPPRRFVRVRVELTQ